MWLAYFYSCDLLHNQMLSPRTRLGFDYDPCLLFCLYLNYSEPIAKSPDNCFQKCVLRAFEFVLRKYDLSSYEFRLSRWFDLIILTQLCHPPEAGPCRGCYISYVISRKPKGEKLFLRIRFIGGSPLPRIDF